MDRRSRASTTAATTTRTVAAEPRAAARAIPWWYALLGGLALLLAAAISAPRAGAQDADDEPRRDLTAAELEDLVGPIALYADDLIGIVLPAATYPLEIVEAARFLERREADEDVSPDDDWDDSVVALLNYPEVVEMLNEDLDWTWQLGEAVLYQRPEVLDAIQAFRARARNAGNLATDNRQVVSEDDGVIEIRPADPKVIYVPYYEPRRVVVYQPAPVVSYYPWSYPVYYYPYPAGYHFDFHAGFFFGVTSAFVIGWNTHFLHVHHHHHHHHPYYGHYFYDPYYARSAVNVNVVFQDNDYVWAPRLHTNHGTGRPLTLAPQTRTVEGRVVTNRTGSAGPTGAAVATRSSEGRVAARGSAAAPDTSRSATAGVASAEPARTRSVEGRPLQSQSRPATGGDGANSGGVSQQRTARPATTPERTPTTRPTERPATATPSTSASSRTRSAAVAPSPSANAQSVSRGTSRSASGPSIAPSTPGTRATAPAPSPRAATPSAGGARTSPAAPAPNTRASGSSTRSGGSAAGSSTSTAGSSGERTRSR